MASSKKAIQRKAEKLLLSFAESYEVDVDRDDVIDAIATQATAVSTVITRALAGEPVKRTRGGTTE